MIVYPSLLVGAAEQAGIEVPLDPDAHALPEVKEKYPHFHILCVTQLGRALQPGDHFENAKKLAKIPVEELKTLTWNQLADYGICPHAATLKLY